MPSRRAVLGLAAAAVTGGCASLGSGCRWGVTVRATPADEVDVRVEDLVPAEGQLVARAVEDGSATATAVRGSPIDDGDVVELDGTYYEVALAEETDESVPALRVDVHPRREDESLGDLPVVDYPSLPENDREALAFALDGSRWEPDRRLSEDFSMGDVPIPYPDGTAESRLAEAGTLWVRRDGEYYHVHVRQEDTIERTTYRYAVSRIGTTREALRAHAIPQDPVRLDDLPADQRAIVDQAIEDEYETCEEEPPPLRNFTERLGSDVDSVPDTYVEYEDEVYELSVQPWGAG